MWAFVSSVFVLFCFLYAHAHNMQKFPGQGSNPHHSSNSIHSSDNARFLTARPPGNSLSVVFIVCWLVSFSVKTSPAPPPPLFRIFSHSTGYRTGRTQCPASLHERQRKDPPFPTWQHGFIQSDADSFCSSVKNQDWYAGNFCMLQACAYPKSQ